MTLRRDHEAAVDATRLARERVRVARQQLDLARAALGNCEVAEAAALGAIEARL